MLLFKPLALLVLSSAALATAQAQTPDAQPMPPMTSATAPATGKVSSPLGAELFYELLLGELNAQGGESASAYPYLLDAARKTGDAKLYQRAVQVALQARDGEAALQAARAWRQALPTSKEANRFVLQILIVLNRISDTTEPLKRDIANMDAKDRPTAISNIPRYYKRSVDKKLAASVVEQALVNQLGQTATGGAAWTTVGFLRMEAGDVAGGLDAARRAQTFDPQAEGPALLALALMDAKTPQAESIVRKYLESSKPLLTIRHDYARLLMAAQRYAEAEVQMDIVASAEPDNAQAWLILGTLQLQDGRPASAEKALKRYVELSLAPSESNKAAPPDGSKGLMQAYLALAQIAEQRGDLTHAQEWLSRINGAQDLLGSTSRQAAILARQGKLEAGRQLIRDLPEKDPIDVRMKLSAEVQLLRDNQEFGLAYGLLQEATARSPQDVDLAYDQAMLAEKLGKFHDMEELLRRVMVLKPEYHHAYNALGYSFAERGVRLPEARQLVLKALEYAPGDPFIADSLGWVEFRSGNLPEAQRILQAAYKDKPDAEIAAHLGEVLWAMGKRSQAMTVWKDGLAQNPENDSLKETLKRLRIKL